MRGLALAILLFACLAKAETELPPPSAEEGSAFPALPPDDGFAPSYGIEAIEVRGNSKTKTAVILRELLVKPGDVVTANDPRVELSRLHLLALGYFLDARLSLEKGETRGTARLLVSVEERGTLVLEDLFLGTSQATTAWGGLTVAERNLLGRGISLGGGVVGSTRPDVEGAVAGFGSTLRLAGPPAFFPGHLSLQGSLVASRGSEFFRATGNDDSARPGDFVSVTTRRLGGSFGVGRGLSRNLYLVGEARLEFLRATFPGTRLRLLEEGALEPIPFSIREGASQLGSVTLGIDWDTRTDPVLPRSGHHVSLSVELSGLLSDYTFVKGTAALASYFPLKSGHILGLHGFLGGMRGDAPYFDRFFVGDVDMLLPRRALGLNFSTQPAHDFLGTGSSAHRFDDLAARALVEYAIPLWKRHGFVYRGDAFAAVGVYALCNPQDLARDNLSFRRALAMDLTADLGLRLDTAVGIFTLSVGNLIGRIPY